MTNIFKVAVLLVLISFSLNSKSQTTKTPFLNKVEAAQAADYLNEVCGETFCRNHFNFTNIGVQCQEYWVIKYDIAPHVPAYFTMGMYQQAQYTQKYGYVYNTYWALENARYFIDFYYSHVGSLVEFENVKIKATCHIYKLKARGLTLDKKMELLLEQQLTCTDSFIMNLARIRSNSLNLSY